MKSSDAIYSAAADPSQWPYVAQQIQHSIGGHSVNLALEDLSESKVNILFTNGVSEHQIEQYQQDVMGRDKLTDLLNVVPEGSAFLSQDFYDLKTVRSMYCYEAFYEPVGYTHFNVGLFYRNNGRRAWLSVARSEDDSQYSESEFLLMQALIPHMRRAFLINLQLAEAQLHSKVAIDSLEHIAAATLLLSDNGNVLSHNTQAEPYLYKPQITSDHYTVRLPDPGANRRLHTLIASLMNDATGNQDGVIPFIDKGMHKTAMCFPWISNEEQHEWLGQTACIIVFILSPNNAPPHIKLLKTAFELSDGEIKVLDHLMAGMNVSEISSALFVTTPAVRFHIRNLLRKTQTRNQAELIAKVFDTTSVMIR